MAQTGTFIYATLRPWIRLGFRHFFKRIEIIDSHFFPKDKAVILISNHQNALLDPLLGCVHTKRQLHWLTRADVFKNPTVAKILASFNMLPVYRERDKVEGIIDKNDQIFKECYARIGSGAVICLFPEGTHRGRKQLFQFKKGMARVAFGAIESGISPKDILVLPMGLDYSEFYNLHPEAVVKFGEAFSLEKYHDLFKQDSNKGMNELLAECKRRLSKLIIDVEIEDGYDEIVYLRDLCFEVPQSKSLKDQYEAYRIFSSKIQGSSYLHDVIDKTKKYKVICDRYHINEEVASGRYSTPLMILGLILLLPFYLVGRTIYAPLERFIENFVKTKVKDPLFKNSIRLAFWTFLLPIYSILISGIASCFFDEKWLMFLMLIVALPLTGWLAKKWLFVYRKWRAVQSFLRFKNSNLRKFDEFEHLRNELIFIIKQKIS